MNNSNEPCATKAERFQKSSLSLMDFNVEEAIKNLEMCLHVGKENISQKKTENCTVLTELHCPDCLSRKNAVDRPADGGH